MNEGQTIFAQVMDTLPRYEFEKCVTKYRGDYRMRSLSCYQQFLIMGFAQLTFRESLRAIGPKLYHSGIRSQVACSTLADANENHDGRIFADFAHILIAEASVLYADEDFGVELKQAAYALDSTTIDLCLSLLPWAKFRKTKAAIKLHTLLDLHGNIPSLVIITSGKVHDVTILDNLILEAGASYIMDRGYLDFLRLHRIQESSAFFVTRAKRNLQCRRQYSRPVAKATGLRFDQTIVLTGYKSHRQYPDPLRRIGYFNVTTSKHFIFLTNNFIQPAIIIPSLYHCRWQVELFFKWIKQHNKGNSFWTRRGDDWKLIFRFEAMTMDQARQLESTIKKMGAARYLRKQEAKKVSGQV